MHTTVTACDNCHKNKGTVRWCGNTDAVSAMRNMSSLPTWCDHCATTEQLKYAKELSNRIPELEKKIKTYEKEA